MQLNPVLLAIPLFFILMALEVVYESFVGHKTYRLNDALTNISTGILNQLTGVFVKVVTVGVYVWLYDSAVIFKLPANGWSFMAVFLLYDLCYYWSHRMAHEVSLFWGGHVVHHQSEEYNLSVALRQSATSFLWSMPFYLPLAIIGFDPMQFLLVGGLNLVYQFWIHTDHIGKLGPLEWVMNTPSHHRVHHGRDPKYIDKNYAGVFIIWDRIFGTFREEEERPNYGITKPLNSWDPVYANIAHYLDLARGVARAANFKESMALLFGPPGGVTTAMAGTAPLAGSKYNQKIDHRGWNGYLAIQFLATVAIAALFLFTLKECTTPQQVVLAIWITASTVVCARMLTHITLAAVLTEVLRLLLLPIFALWLNLPEVIPGVALGWTVVSLAILLYYYRIRHTILKSSHAGTATERPVRALEGQEH